MPPQALDLTAIVTSSLQQLTVWQLFWLLLAVTGVDILSQVVADLAAKAVDPQILAKTANQVLGAFVSAAFAFALLKFQPGNTAIAAIAYGVYIMAMVATLSSFAQHSRETCETLKIPVPYWLGALTAFLAAFPSQFPPGAPALPPGPAAGGQATGG